MRCITVRGLVEGYAEGSLLVYPGYVAFYGEIDPQKGILKPVNSPLKGRILVIRGVRGSTVGPYILYALAKKGLAPVGIIVEHVEPLVVTSAVMANIPLAGSNEITERVENGVKAELRVGSNGSGILCMAL